MTNLYLFIGEKPSKTAIEKNWSWEDGRLAGKQLFDALISNNINPKYQIFCNLWTYDGKINKDIQKILHFYTKEFPRPIVAMGQKVQDQLTKMNVEFISIIHPAARGKIRKKELYAKHLSKMLS